MCCLQSAPLQNTQTGGCQTLWYPASDIWQAVRCARLRQVHSHWGEPHCSVDPLPTGSGFVEGSARTETRVWRLREREEWQSVKGIETTFFLSRDQREEGLKYVGLRVYRDEFRFRVANSLQSWRADGPNTADRRGSPQTKAKSPSHLKGFWVKGPWAFVFQVLSGWIQVSVDGEADRSIHLLANEPGGSGVGLDRGPGQDPVGGQNLLLCCSSRQLGLLQFPEEQYKNIVKIFHLFIKNHLVN